MFTSDYFGCIEKLWRKLGLGAPQMSAQNTTTMSVDGALLTFANALDGAGVEVSVDIGVFSESMPVRQQQIESVLHANLACLSRFDVLAMLTSGDDGFDHLQLSVRFRGYTEQDKLVGLIEDLLSALTLYQPLLGQSESGFPQASIWGADQRSLADEIDGAMVFQL
ncbi:hypothetical protein [Pseudovibrio sp. Tun.PSC04-5.I4]|uniref:hypothetical protein n=1 Tax=Pseudovibrio sp. Tun.PSC04-5.I4 TaxID=1798213 RepID=UPI0008863A08|nr:hypothetical protein [Pseudovibrio sp. Tun.PSC04-5.I4]SDR15031.1 hypothetical protein SAMN04515695_3030 [Pseudovibrio sp. Tun.PSC04-5.I4]